MQSMSHPTIARTMAIREGETLATLSRKFQSILDNFSSLRWKIKDQAPRLLIFPIRDCSSNLRTERREDVFLLFSFFAAVSFITAENGNF